MFSLFKSHLRRSMSFALLPLCVACAGALDNKTSATDSEAGEELKQVVDSFNIMVDWGASDRVDMGMGTTSLSMTAMDQGGTDGNFPTCYDNNRTCRRAPASLIGSILNNPTVVQAFQLNFGYSDTSGRSNGTWSQVVIQGASVTTAELKFTGDKGDLSLGPAVTNNLTGSCSLSNSNAVGYANTPGSEKILVGLRLFEEGTQSTSTANLYTNAYQSAGRVWVSGLYPDGSHADHPFGFKFLPTLEAVTADFGLKEFTTTSSGSVVVSPKFEASSSTANYKSHVIIGFCLQGYKSGSSGTRPLVYFSRAWTRRPNVRKVQ